MKKQISIISIFVLLTAFSVSQNEWLAYDVFSTTPENDLLTNYISKVHVDGTGCYWLLSFYCGITKYQNGELYVLNDENGLASNSPRDIFEDSNGNIWIVYMNEQGITKYDGQNYINFNTDNYLSCNNISEVFEDSQQNIWLRYASGNDCGTSVYNGESWITYTMENGLAANGIKYIIEDNGGNIVVTYKHTSNAGFSVFDGLNWITYTISDGLPSNQVSHTLLTINGEIWLSYDEDVGVTRVSNGVITNFTEIDGLFSDDAYMAHADNSGHVWVRCHHDIIEPNYAICRYDGSDFSTYTIDNGLAALSVNEFYNDSEGNVWINYFPRYNGTGGAFGEPTGITKYDGNSFTTLSTEDGLASNLVSSLYEDQDNNLWFNHYSYSSQAFYFGNPYGLTKWNGTDYIIYDTLMGLKSNLLWGIFEESNGDIWFRYGEKCGATVFKDQSFVHYGIEDGMASNGTYGYYEDNENRVILKSNGLSIYDGSWSKIIKQGGLLYDISNSIAEDEEGNLFFSSSLGVTQFNGYEWIPYTSYNGLAENSTKELFQTSNYGLWCKHNSNDVGVSQFDGSDWIVYNSDNYLQSDWVREIYEDSSGNLWVLYIGQEGITRYDGQNWIHYTITDGLHSDGVGNIVEDNEGNIWVFSDEGASLFNGTSWESYNSTNGLAYDLVQDIFVSSTNDVWFTYPFWHDDLCAYPWQITKFDGETWESYLPDELWHMHDYGVKEDQSGHLWIATIAGVIYYDGVNWDLITSEDGLASNGCGQVFIQSNDTKWFLTGGGVSRFDGSSWESYTEDDVLEDNSVNQILEDTDGNLWFRYSHYSNLAEHYGATKFDGENWITYNESNGLVSNSVSELYEDQTGFIWALTNRGLNKYTGNVGFDDHFLNSGSYMTISPNPLQENGFVSFFLSEKSQVNIAIYDNQGKQLYELCDKIFESGSQNIKYSLSDYSSGMYYCTLKINGEMLDSQKVIKQ